MKKVSLADVFSTEYLEMVIKYKRRLQDILLNYDVAIFMARKSICFYKALVSNEELIPNDTCMILSSRALSYNIIQFLKGKKIAIIDDVIVTGKTLSKSKEFFDANNMDVDIHFMACEKEFVDNLSFSESIGSPYICLSSLNIFQLSSYITDYICVSMIPYNIDQPIYNILFENTYYIDNIIKTNNTSSLADGAEKTYGIKNFSIHFKSSILNESLGLNFENKDVIFKIRFLCHDEETNLIATPFIILPKMEYAEIDRIFSKFSNAFFDKLIFSENKEQEYENKLKFLQYMLCNILFLKFSKNLNYKNIFKDTKNEILLFGTEILPEEKYSNFEYSGTLTFTEQATGISNYNDFNSLVSDFYDYILNVNDVAENGRIITFESLISSMNYTNRYNLSSVIDVFIDKGILVPEFVHCSANSIVRGYKCGEIFHLTKRGIELFAYMLDQYANTKNGKPLDKIELEKLCVLFFKNVAYKNRLFSAVKEFEDDCFSICYSKFGPRVSDSNRKYKVKNKSALASVLEDREMVSLYNDKYFINVSSAPVEKSWGIIAVNFSLTFYRLRQCFEREIIKPSNYIRTYNDFLTLLAIGASKKNQMFALMAELYLFVQIDMHFSLEEILHSMDYYVETKETHISPKKYRGIIDGIDSGLWKYFCFCQDGLMECTFNQMIKEYNDIRFLKEDYIVMLDEKDENDIYKVLVDKCGRLLYEIAYLFNYAQKRFTKQEKNPMFRKYPFDNPDFKLMKSSIEHICAVATEHELIDSLKTLKKRALALINECDLCIEEAAFRSVRIFNNIVVLYNTDKKIERRGNEINLKPSKGYDVIDNCLFIKGNNDDILSQLYSIINKYELASKSALILFVCVDNSYEGIFNSDHIATGDYFKELVKTAIKKSGFNERENTCKLMICSRKPESIQEDFLEFDSSGALIDGYKYLKYNLLRGDFFMANNTSSGDFKIDGLINMGTLAIGNGNVIEQKTNSLSELDKFFEHIQQMNTNAIKDNTDAMNIVAEINQAASKKDKNKVLSKLYSLAEKVGSSVFAKIASSLIVEVMKQNGYIPF